MRPALPRLTPVPTPVVLFAIFGLAGPATADVIHSSETINSATVWSAADNDHVVVGQVSITQTGTLTIEDGCHVLFDANAKLDVSGTLNAIGGASGILFTRRDPGETWSGIYFRHPSDGTLSDCTIEHASATNIDAIRVDQTAVVTIQDCTIRNNGRGIRAYQGSGPTISGCVIENNAVGIRYEQAVSPMLTSGNTLLNNGNGVIFSQCTDPTIDNQTIIGSSGTEGAIFVQASGEFTIGSGNAVTGNSWGLTIDTGSGPSVASAGNIPLAGNTNDDGIQVVYAGTNQAVTWKNLGADYVVTVPTLVSGTLTIDQGCTIRFDAGTHLEVTGTLNALGGIPGILFTKRDVGEAWGGIQFWTGDGSFENCTIEHASVSGEAGIRVQASNVSIQDCVIRNCARGIRVPQGPEPTISGCTIENNETGIRYDNVPSPSLTAANTFTNNTTGIMFQNCAGPTIDNQTITGSDGIEGALYLQSCGEFTLGPSNTITGNTWGVTIDTGSAPSLACAGNIPMVGNTYTDGIQVRGGSMSSSLTWRDFGAKYVVTSAAGVSNSGHLTIDGVEVLFGFNIDLSVVGSLTATDAHFRPWDDSGTLHWSGLQFWTGNGVFQDCLIWGVEGFNGGVPALVFDGGSTAALDNVWLTQNDVGMKVNGSSSASLKRCRIVENDDYGIYVIGTSTVTFGADLTEWNDVHSNGGFNSDRDLRNGSQDIVARYVYWGTTDEGAIEANIFHEPDSGSLGLVSFAPWTDSSHTQQFGAAFTDVTPAALLQPADATGAAWGDCDGDGDHDLYVFASGPNHLFRNDDGTFVDVTPAALADTAQSLNAVFNDRDNDGDLDLFVAELGYPWLLARNDGTSWLSFRAGLPPHGSDLEVADFDRDGDLDLLEIPDTGPSYLWENTGWFYASREETPGPESGRNGAWGDFDDDGDPDYVIAGQEASAPEVTFVRNDGSQGFSTLVSYTNVTTNLYSTVAWTDSDGDGLLNAHVGGYGFADIVICSDGQTPFPCTPPSLADSGYATSASWGDFDNDGQVDLYLTKQGAPNRLFQNLGSGTFADVATGELAASNDLSTASWADYDGDGDLDLFLAVTGGPNRLLRNDGAANHWLHVDLEGFATNRFGVGATITVHAGGSQLVHEVGTGSGHGAQNSLTAEFGLGATTVVDSVVVRWLSGSATYGPFAADQRVTLSEPLLFVGNGELPIVATSASWGDYDADGDEDLFCTRINAPDRLFRNDSGRLIEATPALFEDSDSTSGSAWGDYDNDGLLDLLVTYEETSSYTTLYHNDGGGAFSWTTYLAPGAICHQATWVDYDGDGDLDAYLCADANPNRLFRNDGGGVFEDDTTGPLFGFYDERHAAWGDYDDDCDPDLFSSRSDGDAALLRNDGGSFVDISADLPISISNVFGGEWVDYDDDGDLDLFVTVAYSPGCKLLRNDPSGLVDVTPPALEVEVVGSSWQDHDNDGDLDFLGADFGSSPILRRNDDGVFVDSSDGFWPAGSLEGAAWGDLDENGGIDLVFYRYYTTIVCLNTLNNGSNGWLRIHLQGTVSNRSAIGARVTAVTGSKRQMRELTVHGDYRSQNSLVVHFGLGQATTADSLIVRWPSGIEQVLTGVAANSEITVVEEATTDVEVAAVPTVFSVGQSFPNPFRSSTRIAFGLPEPSHVSLRIFDVSGRLVRTLSNDTRPAGRYTARWDGRDGSGRPVATGIYFYRFEAGSFRESRRLVRLR